MSGNLFNIQYINHNQMVDLEFQEAVEPSQDTVMLNGRNYVLKGDSEEIAWLKNAFPELSDTGMTIENLRSRLQSVESKQIFKSFKAHEVGLEVLQAKEITSKEKSLQGLIPGLCPIEDLKPMNLEKKMEAYNVPGVGIAVVNNGEIEWSEGFGNLRNEKTRIQAASISKTITAVAVMTLVREGKLKLTDDASAYIDKKLWDQIYPEANPNKKDSPVTIEMLLSHTGGITLGEGRSGFNGYPTFDALPSEIGKLENQIRELQKSSGDSKTLKEAEESLIWMKALQEKGRLPSTDEILLGNRADNPAVNSGAVRVTGKPQFDPDNFAYQGGGTMILQKVIENIVYPQTFSQYVDASVFKPLGMTNSTFEIGDNPKSNGHQYDGQPVEGGSHQYPELAAAGAWSTPRDLALMMIEIQKAYHGKSEKTIGHENAQKMLQPLMGLGVAAAPMPEGAVPYFFHEGANAGFRCIMVGNTHGQGAVIMTNADNGETLRGELVARIAEVYDWKDRDKFDMLEPQMDLKEAARVNAQAWYEKSRGIYEFNPEPGVIKTLSINRNDQNRIVLEITVKEGNEMASIEQFDLFPIGENRGCFRDGIRAAYNSLDLVANADDEVVGVFLFGEKFDRLE